MSAATPGRDPRRVVGEGLVRLVGNAWVGLKLVGMALTGGYIGLLAIALIAGIKEPTPSTRWRARWSRAPTPTAAPRLRSARSISWATSGS
ncbi:MAG: hypothetical protein U0232_02895 [Thermomicrobiales bacterium]